MRIKVKMNVAKEFNHVVDFVNKIAIDACEDCEQELETEKKCEACPEYPTIPRELQVIDVKFKIIMENLKEIGQRAIELKDPKLIEVCTAMGILVESDDKG